MKFEKTINNMLKSSNVRITSGRSFKTYREGYDLYIDRYSIFLRKFQKTKSTYPLQILAINNTISIYNYTKIKGK